MGYQDNDRFGRGREQGYRSGAGDRDAYGRGGYRRSGYSERNRYDEDSDDRGFFDRAGDEVRSWFGDEEAERRRMRDQREYYREHPDHERGYGRSRWGGGQDDGYRPGVGYGGSARRGYFSGDGAGDYGAGRGAGATGSWGLGAGGDRETWAHDPYRSYRQRQMAEFDRDYDEYRREHQSKFESDFGSWREGRQKQRHSLRQVTEHQEVVGSDGQHVGTVDKVRDDRIILTKNDGDARGHHHSIPCSWITSVGDKVEINKTADEAHNHWRDEEKRSAFLGEENRDRDNGPHYLNRSFSGTY